MAETRAVIVWEPDNAAPFFPIQAIPSDDEYIRALREIERQIHRWPRRNEWVNRRGEGDG